MSFEEWEGKCELSIQICFDDYYSIRIDRNSGFGDYFDHFDTIVCGHFVEFSIVFSLI